MEGRLEEREALLFNRALLVILQAVAQFPSCGFCPGHQICKCRTEQKQTPEEEGRGSCLSSVVSSFQIVPPSVLPCNSDPPAHLLSPQITTQGALDWQFLLVKIYSIKLGKKITKNLYDKMYIIYFYIYIYFSLFKYFHVVLMDIQYGLPTMVMVSTALITPRPHS